MLLGDRPRILILGWDDGSPGGRLAQVGAALGGCLADTGALTRANPEKVIARVDELEIIGVARPRIQASPRALAGLAKRMRAARSFDPYRADPMRARLAEYLERVPADLVHVLDRRWLPAASVAYSSPSAPRLVLDPGLAQDPSAPSEAVELSDHSADALRLGYAETGVIDAWQPAAPPEPTRSVAAGAAPRVGIGMSNFAGQGWEWMRALREAMPEASTVVLAKEQETLNFPADLTVTIAQYHVDPIFRGWVRREARGTWTHAVLESGRGILGAYTGTLADNIDQLRAWGVEPALLFHGTDLRNPAQHAATHPRSPYHHEGREFWVERQQRRTDVARDTAIASGAPVLVSTPDLLQYVPGSQWLPVVSNMASERGSRAVHDVPVVLHAPSDSQKKGSELVDPILADLDEAGLIEYRRLRGVPVHQMPAWLSDADIVVDQFAVGSYGVLAVEAMRCGAAVVSDVDPEVRDFIAQRTGLDLPILQATPESLAQAIGELVADPAAIDALAKQGVAFAHEVHDGRLSGEILADWVRATTARQ